ncbi:MAG TPA: aminotransferase class I/II-fold pyridoxal phosphate-dependent enzyme [Stellaceae bacterium]|jgi:8-amino-7-oxononanoate synthase|nr:aminotransferase class I/II-fold pyridoxal phosphate-dependent enzyme [Stellaceae bacterium]
MALGRNVFGLSPQAKARLLEKVSAGGPKRAAARAADRAAAWDGNAGRLSVTELEGSKEIRMIREAAEFLGIADPFFRVHDGVAGAETIIAGKRYANFASYNYVGLNGHPEIAVAAKAAIDRWGTSVSASRPVSGERTVHRDLERALARLHRAEDSVALVGGHSTNVTLIGHLLGRDDVIVHDALIHNSVVEGARLSGARRVPFPHLDHEAADRRLAEARPRGGHALLVIEGHYSMDGDVPDLPAFIAVARRHRAWLMVDEAHALGVLGARGFGTADYFGVDPGEVDIWMGTLSKSLVACGGYIAGRAELIDYLKLVLPGFVFSVGMAPPTAAAALAALAILEREPGRVRRLNDRAALFLKLAREGGLDVGGSIGASIVPVITGGSIRAGRLAQAMFGRGVNVQPILYPAVPERAARLRFFLTAEHSEEQVREAVRILLEESRRIASEPTDFAAVIRHLGRRALPTG